MTDRNASIIEEFRANEGQIGGNFAGAPLLLLHSTGAKSGEPMVHPMMYEQVDGGSAVSASKAGADLIRPGTSTWSPIARRRSKLAPPPPMSRPGSPKARSVNGRVDSE